MENINVGIHNCFDIIVRDADTGEIKQTGRAENILLNAFWDYFLNSTYNDNCLDYIQFGSGTADPVATDTALTARIAGLICATDTTDKTTYYTDGIIKRKKSIRLEAGVYTGRTISEVGFASGVSSGLRTKALVKDANGNPLNITIGATDVVDIFATFFAKVPMSIVNGTSGIKLAINKTAGVVKFLICDGAAVNSPYFVAGKNHFPFGFEYYSDGEDCYRSGSSLSYSVGAKKRTITVDNIVAANGNIGGFSSLFISDVAIQIPCAGFAQPTITKEVIATGDGGTKDFKCAFGGILNNSTAKLYVNDVEVAATFDYDLPGPNKYVQTWMKLLTNFETDESLPLEFENPYYEKFGLNKIRGDYFSLYASNDRTNWSLAASRSSSVAAVTIGSTYKNYRYWKIEANIGSSWSLEYLLSDDALANLVIHAESAPTVGSTVALTYQPNCIAKDASHVINNISVTLTFNEYTP